MLARQGQKIDDEMIAGVLLEQLIFSHIGYFVKDPAKMKTRDIHLLSSFIASHFSLDELRGVN
ncbi:hypothetical protein GF354_00430 [Candidatus Peregrinibacteria bacterium]|nr:hypothetical protein [Candidatus Peregrinibacteria bacterium]